MSRQGLDLRKKGSGGFFEPLGTAWAVPPEAVGLATLEAGDNAATVELGPPHQLADRGEMGTGGEMGGNGDRDNKSLKPVA